MFCFAFCDNHIPTAGLCLDPSILIAFITLKSPPITITHGFCEDSYDMLPTSYLKDVFWFWFPGHDQKPKTLLVGWTENQK